MQAKLTCKCGRVVMVEIPKVVEDLYRRTGRPLPTEVRNTICGGCFADNQMKRALRKLNKQ